MPNGQNYTIRGTRGAGGRRRSRAMQDLHEEACDAERVQRELRTAFWLAIDEGVHPQFAGLDVSLFAGQIADAREVAGCGAAA